MRRRHELDAEGPIGWRSGVNGGSLSGHMRTWTLLSLATATGALAQQPTLGVFDGHADVGRTPKPGSAVYDAARDEYTIAGSGANMWLDRDDFHFVWTQLEGNFILTARARFSGAGVEPHRKLGWTVRSTLATGAPHVTAAVHGDGLVALQFRRTAGGATEEVRSSVTAADVIQLERAGNRYILSVGRFGDTLAPVRVADLALGDRVYVGLFVCAHNDTVIERATFRDVRITVPARDSFVPYRDYLGSNVEILDVATGDRTIVYRSPASLQAPNWTKDGTALIYNSGGLLYRFDLADRRPAAVNTGFATSNNNDHVLSFDGRTLGISNHSKDDHDASIVYTVPAGGGTPRRVTALGPSYLHGWSPTGSSWSTRGSAAGSSMSTGSRSTAGRRRASRPPRGWTTARSTRPTGRTSISTPSAAAPCSSGACDRTAAPSSSSRTTGTTTGSPTCRPTASGSCFCRSCRTSQRTTIPSISRSTCASCPPRAGAHA